MNRFPVENIDKVEDAVNAEVASKLATAKNIKLTGDVTGTASFDGTKDASIVAVIADDSHNHTIANIDNLQNTLDSINDTIESAVSTAGASLSVSGTSLSLNDAEGTVLSTVSLPKSVDPASATPLVAGTAAVGTSTKYAREDHVHPVQTSVTGSSGSCTGNAATATKATQDESGNNIKSSYASSMEISGGTITLKSKSGATLSSGTVSVSASSAAKLTTARTIYVKTTAGDHGSIDTKVVTGSASFDGSANVTITLPDFLTGSSTYNTTSNCNCNCSSDCS